MKKIILVISTVIMLTGCASKEVLLKEPQNLFSLNGKNYNEQDIFNQILKYDVGQLLIQNLEMDVIESIQEGQEYDIDDKLASEVEKFEKLAASINMDLESLVKMYGLPSVQVLVDDLKRGLVMQEHSIAYATENFEEFIREYEAYEMKVYTVDSEETAQKMMRYVENKYEADLFEEEFDLSEFETQVYYNQMQNVEEELYNSFVQLPTDKIAYNIQKEDVKVYLYQEGFSDQAAVIKELISKTDFSQKVLAKEVKKKGFKVYNKTLKENLKIDFEDYLQ